MAAIACAAMLSGCFGSTEQPSDTSQSAVSSAATATSADKKDNASTEDTSSSASALASEDEPDSAKEERPLAIAVNGLSDGYSPFDDASECTALEDKLTGVTLIGHTRGGDTVSVASSPKTEQYGGKTYGYSGIADITPSYDAETDTTTYRIALRNDVKFADGELLSADDVIFTMYVHLDPSYTGSSPLQEAGIVGAINYRFDSAAADSITQERIDEVLESDEIIPLIKEQIVLPTLKAQFENIKSFYGDSAYSVYTSKYPKAEELFAFFYSISGDYSAKGKNAETVISDIADMYGGDYRQLASMTVGDETVFDDQAQSIAVGYLTEQAGDDTETERVRSVSGIVREGDFSLAVTVNGDGSGFEKALESMVIAPLHYYGSETYYDYENEMFGFIKGRATASLAEKRDRSMGAGAYVMTSAGSEEILLEANPYYYKGVPGFSAIKLVNGSPADAAALIADGTADICVSDGSAENYGKVEAENRSIEKIYPLISADTGYGYIGLNADTICIGDQFSDQSYALRKGIATAIAYFKKESVDTYFGGYGQILDYPLIEGLEMDKNADGYIVPYNRDVNGNPIVSPDMTPEESREAVKSACIGFFKAAGYTFSDAGVITAVPNGGEKEYSAVIAADGTGNHPSYIALKKASELLDEIGMHIKITDTDDASVLWEALSSGTQQIWAGAWNDESLTTVYVDSYYGADSTKLKAFIRDAEAADEEDRQSAFMKCYDRTVNTYAVEVPMYRRIQCTLFSTLRIDISTLTPDMTDSYDWSDEIWSIKPKQR